jgi:putative pyruvate formate lyase activating enzyme
MSKINRRDFLDFSMKWTGMFVIGSPAGSLPNVRNQKKEKKKELYPSYLKLHKEGKLKERIKELKAYYESCTLCPRDCRVNRTKGELGKCRASDKVKISSAFPHFGEEAPLVGTHGSGTIFFSNCGLRCIYCQNYEISFEGSGEEVSNRRLARAMIKMQEFRCHNVNLVTPTHYLPNIVDALNMAIPMGLKIPLVYNTGGYEKPEVLKLLDGIVDIYLPDFKYMNPEHSAEYSSEAYNYPYYARLAFKEMFRQVGDLKTAERGIARRGLIIRHLVLPNRVSDTKQVLEFIAEEISKSSYINVMRQYRPEYKAKDYPKISRRLKRNEYNEALKWAKELGLNRLAR